MSVAEIGSLAAAAALLSALFTHLSLRYALRLDMLDHPGARRSHQTPTPRGGGAAIVLVLGLSVLWLPLPVLPAWSLLLAVGAVALIGWIDDHRSLPVLPRLAVHAVAAATLVVGLMWEAWSVSALSPLTLLLLPLLVVAGINFCNFMDGINGIASSQAALVLVACAVLIWPAAPVWAAVFTVAAAACCGFLPFNFPRARIFLGDVGSGALGLLVMAALIQVWWLSRIPAAALLLLISAFALDAVLTLVQRVVQGKRWYRPHREHLYQWWVRSGQSHTAVTIRYAVWTLLMIGLLVLGRHWPNNVWNLLAAIMLPAAAVGWYLAKRRVLVQVAKRSRSERSPMKAGSR